MDEDENGKGKSKGKDIAPEDTLMAEDDSDSAAKITTPSKTHEVTKRTSTRGRPIGSGSKKGCSPPHIFFLFINHFVICCLSLSRPQVSYGKIPGVGQITHVHRWGLPRKQGRWSGNYFANNPRNLGHSTLYWWRNASPFFVLEDGYGMGVCCCTN